MLDKFDVYRNKLLKIIIFTNQLSCFLLLFFIGREYKQDWTFERQILRWIEKHGNLGITLSDISRAFRFTTDGSVIRILKKLTKLNYLTKSYCDRGRTKVFR